MPTAHRTIPLIRSPPPSFQVPTPTRGFSSCPNPPFSLFPLPSSLIHLSSHLLFIFLLFLQLLHLPERPYPRHSFMIELFHSFTLLQFSYFFSKVLDNAGLVACSPIRPASLDQRHFLLCCFVVDRLAISSTVALSGVATQASQPAEPLDPRSCIKN